MTQEDKSLLLKDLCARLPYGAVYHRNDGANIKLNEIDVDHCRLNYTDDIEGRDCKPYLRPMSSMTEEEWKEYRDITCCLIENCEAWNEVDWLNKHHFDYRGLIEKGLAIEVTEENNPYKRLKL